MPQFFSNGRWFVFFVAFFGTAVFCIASVRSEEDASTEPDDGVVEIPLSDIWGYWLPGTRDIRELDLENLPQPFLMLNTGSLDALQRLNIDKAAPGFAVHGTGQNALVAAHKKLPDGQSPPRTLAASKEISLVYFSHGFGRHIVLKEVRRVGNSFEIRYRFESTGQEALSNHIALIPIGKLAPGKYRVETIQASTDEAIIRSWPEVTQMVKNAVCRSFEFDVVSEE